MPDYRIVERKLAHVSKLEDLPIVTAATPEDACKAYAVSVGRIGTFFALDTGDVVKVKVEANVTRTLTATRVVA